MAATDQSTRDYLSYRIRRDARGVIAWFREHWQGDRWFRLSVIALGGFLLVWAIFWAIFTRDLPDAGSLVEYEPPLPTMVRGVDGEIVGTYARERRVQLQFQDLPRALINSFLAAEDKTFWSHGGIDYGGFAGAVIDYVSKIGSGQRAVGGSTITQQVAKNILLGDEYSITRKLREMILARRIESVLTKQDIITLYLNEIPLGRRSYGVQAAARAYFDKDVDQLKLHEMAFLAILPKAPERYGRPANREQAVERRNFVLSQMASNSFITPQEAEAAKTMPLGLVAETGSKYRTADAGYYLEEVRRQLIDKYGEQADDGPNGVYAGGLWVRTSLDTDLQAAARKSLRAGLLRFGGNRWNGPLAKIDLSKGSWRGQLQSSNLSISYENWRVGVVTARNGGSATIGFSNGDEAPLGGLPEGLKAGDVIVAAPNGNAWVVRSIPEISGGFLAQDPNTGRVLAMQGGFDARLSDFNRATQANRQPGSTIKPFVYATGLDQGMTPATMVTDGTFCVWQGANLGQKCFRNFSGDSGGQHTMRWGLEQSRNLMTVHIANDAGMENVTRTFSRIGIGDYDPYLSFALGAGETTVERMVRAYSSLVNHGIQAPTTVIDYVQDRRGKVIWRADERACARCNMDQWDGKAMPRLKPRGKQVLDPRTAYQVVHMLEGVVQRGTATVLRDLELPLFGKTGTTNGPTDVWFVGGSPDIIAGVYIGYDKPRSMGGWAQGGRIAAPIFKQFVQESRSRWNGRPFLASPGVRMVRVDRRTGKRVFDAWPTDDPRAAVIWEAFKPDTEPRRGGRQDEVDAMRDLILAQLRQKEQGSAVSAVDQTITEPGDFVEEQGGIY